MMACLEVGYMAFVFFKLIINAIGLVGNAMCIIVLFQKEMRSSFSYYLMGLTVSDAMCLILSVLWCLDNLKFIDLNSKKFNRDELDFTQAFVFVWDWIGTGGTKYFTIAISLERFVAVCYPLKARQWLTTKRSKMFAISIFAFDITVTICSFFYNYYFDEKSYEIYAAIVVHFSPFGAIVVINSFTLVALCRFKRKRKNLSESELADISVTRMLLTVVFVFGFCYSFEFTRRILNYVGYFESDKKYLYHDYMIRRLADIFYALNSSVNFIIYYLLGTKFRTQFLGLVKKFTSKVVPDFTKNEAEAICELQKEGQP